MDIFHALNEQAPTFVWPVKFCVTMAAVTYVLSLITGNVSQVDRVWTFLPTIYTAYFALLPLWPRTPALFLFPYAPESIGSSIAGTFSPRALLMLALVVTWMFRLSYNTWRRGLFSLKDEDYRWEILRQKIPKSLFQLFNLTFIAIAQNIILFLLGIPTQIAVSEPHAPLGTSDYVLGVLGFLTILVEFTADNQQYSFQTYKRSRKIDPNEWPGAQIQWTPQDAERGFVTRGLWGWSRHPNFFCEQTFWIIINLLPILASSFHNPVLKASISSLAPFTPCLVLCSLFYSSTLFTEAISLSKYPIAYAAYQQRVGMFIPLLTPVWGLILSIRGKKTETDKLVYGTGERKKVA